MRDGDCTTPWIIEFARKGRSNDGSVEDGGCFGRLMRCRVTSRLRLVNLLEFLAKEEAISANQSNRKFRQSRIVSRSDR